MRWVVACLLQLQHVRADVRVQSALQPVGVDGHTDFERAATDDEAEDVSSYHVELSVTARGVGVDGRLAVLPRERADQARDLKLPERLPVVVAALEIEIAETCLCHEAEAGDACRRDLLVPHDRFNASEHVIALAEHHQEAVRHGDIAFDLGRGAFPFCCCKCVLHARCPLLAQSGRDGHEQPRQLLGVKRTS
jgi:hypothetical protein